MTIDVSFHARGVSKSFGKRRVLDGLDLELAPGAVTVLLGRNGAGKSTLMRLALGVLVPDGGALTVAGGDPVRDPDRVRARVGYVPDAPDACGWMKLGELLRFERAHFATWDDAEAERLVDLLEVPGDIRLRDLSRGQATKAMLCLALAHRPALLLLDEPFSGIDPLARDEVLRAVISALDGAQRTVLCATHELEVATRIADRIAILQGGRIARHGALAEILDCGDEADAAPRRLAEEFAAATQGAATC